MDSRCPSPPGGRYQRHERLGGSASRVHRAHDVLLQRDVAIKSFPGDDGPQRWERDARLRDRMGPGRAMEVLDGAQHADDGPFVVMPFARAGSLEAAAGPWDPSSVALLVERLAVGLGCLHGAGGVHGGVSADAVLLDPEHGPRWTGQGAAPADGTTPADDVAAFARVATVAVTGPLAVVPAPPAEVVDAVQSLVSSGPDAAARERLRRGLADVAARHGVSTAPPAGLGAVAAGRARRGPRVALAACAAAVVMGGVFGIGLGIAGGHGSAAEGSATLGVFGPGALTPALDTRAPAAPGTPPDSAAGDRTADESSSTSSSPSAQRVAPPRTRSTSSEVEAGGRGADRTAESDAAGEATDSARDHRSDEVSAESGDVTSDTEADGGTDGGADAGTGGPEGSGGAGGAGGPEDDGSLRDVLGEAVPGV